MCLYWGEMLGRACSVRDLATRLTEQRGVMKIGLRALQRLLGQVLAPSLIFRGSWVGGVLGKHSSESNLGKVSL
jgi:hypothetical protein